MLVVLEVLPWAITALFVLLAAVVLIDWLRRREAGRGYLVLATGLLATTAVVLEVDDLIGDPTHLFGIAEIAGLLGAGYCLFLFRSSFMPSSVRSKVLIGIAVAMAIGLAVDPFPDNDVLKLITDAAIVLVWTLCVGDPIVRFWVASRGRPAVQGQRLRALSLAYSGILVYLVISIVISYVPSEAVAGQPVTPAVVAGQYVTLFADFVILLVIPLLYVAFSPPQWLRRRWRRSEQELFRLGLQDLLLASSDRAALAAKGLDWSIRLVGAESGLVLDSNEAVLTERDIDDDVRDRLIQDWQAGGGDRLVQLSGPPRRTAILLHLPFEHGDGALAVVSGPFSPFFGHEEVDMLGQYALGITAALERVSLIDALATASSAKSQFLSRMSHELRTPLNSILGFAQLLEDDHLDSEQHDSAERIIKGGQQLLTLINEILDLSRIESGSMQVDLEPVSVAEVVSESIELMRPWAVQADVTIDVSGEISGYEVQADRQRLGQVLLNLLSNAIKYNRRGGEVRVYAEERGGRLLIHVNDNGDGIEEDKINRLFEPFDRLGAEQTDVEGTGMGLSLSRAMARLMGGEVDVVTQPGDGADFWLELPLLETRRIVPAAAVPLRPAPRKDGTGSVLYIEDNAANVDLIEIILRRHGGVTMHVAMQGRLGLDLAAERHYDMVLLDMQLPDMTGLDVLKTLRADERTRDIPVVVVSADATQVQIDAALAAGAERYLTKPLDIKLFTSVVEEVLAA